MPQTKGIDINYIAGMIETDGTLQLNLALTGFTIKPEIRIAATSNTNVLPAIEAFLTSNGISSSIDLGRGVRADSLRIQSRNNVKSFIKLLKTATITNVLGAETFIGVKLRSLMIMELALDDTKAFSKAQILDLKKTLHKTNYAEPDILLSYSTPREEREVQMG